MHDPYTTPDFAGAALITIDVQRDTGGANVDLCRRRAELLLAGAVQALGPNEAAIYKPRWGALSTAAMRSRGSIAAARRS